MKHRIASAAALLISAPPAYTEPLRFGFDAEYSRDSNASRGLFDADRKADNILSAEGSLSGGMPLGPRGGVVYRAAARYSHFSTFQDLSNVALSGRLAYRIQPGADFSSPFFEVSGNLSWLAHQDSELRDGTIVSLEASAGSHLTDRVRLGAGLARDKRDGGSAGVVNGVELYDLSNTRVWATADYRFGLSNTAYARIMRVTGDHVFNSVTVTGLSGKWAIDSALGKGLGDVVNSYRLDATTLVYELGVNIPLSGNSALDILATSYRSEADEGPFAGKKYTGLVLRAGYLHRF